jgi:hypothetical protein
VEDVLARPMEDRAGAADHGSPSVKPRRVGTCE